MLSNELETKANGNDRMVTAAYAVAQPEPPMKILQRDLYTLRGVVELRARRVRIHLARNCKNATAVVMGENVRHGGMIHLTTTTTFTELGATIGL